MCKSTILRGFPLSQIVCEKLCVGAVSYTKDTYKFNGFYIAA